MLAGTSGLGFASASALAGEGVKVNLVGQDKNVGHAAAYEIGSGASFIQGELLRKNSPNVPMPVAFVISIFCALLIL